MYIPLVNYNLTYFIISAFNLVKLGLSIPN